MKPQYQRNAKDYLLILPQPSLLSKKNTKVTYLPTDIVGS